MKKSKVILLWVTFIIIVNLAFICLVCLKSKVLAVIVGVLAAAALVAAIIGSIRFNVAAKKAAKARAKYAREAAANWQPKK